MKSEKCGQGMGKAVLCSLGIFFFGQLLLGGMNLWTAVEGYQQAKLGLEQRQAFVGKYTRVQGTLEGLVKDLVKADAAGNTNVKKVLENAKVNIDVR